MNHRDPAKTAICVLTYNLGDGLAPPDRVVALIRALRPDISGLQEVNGAMGNALPTLADAAPSQIVHPLGIPGKALLSRYPIVSTELLNSDPVRPDLLATIEMGGVLVTVIVAHPPPPHLTRSGLVDRRGTAAQVADLLGIVAATDGPLLLLGDLNAVARHTIPRGFTAAGLVDVARAVGHAQPTYPVRLTSPNPGGSRLRRLPVRPVLRLDYIWASRHWGPISASLGPDAGSDHLPVEAMLELVQG